MSIVKDDVGHKNNRKGVSSPRIPFHTTRSLPSGTIDQVVTIERQKCLYCEKSFTKGGMGLHVKRSHPEEYNININTDEVKLRWSDEEIRLSSFIAP